MLASEQCHAVGMSSGGLTIIHKLLSPEAGENSATLNRTFFSFFAISSYDSSALVAALDCIELLI